MLIENEILFIKNIIKLNNGIKDTLH